MIRTAFILILLAATIIGCSEPRSSSETSKKSSTVNDFYLEEPESDEEPNVVTVQHFLIAFKDSRPQDKDPRNPQQEDDVTRSLEEAEVLARKLFEEAKTSDDFDGMVKKYTNDSHPGIYKIVNYGISGRIDTFDESENVFERVGLATAFGDVSFQLEVGEVGLAEYDQKKSPFGYHIIKRLK